VRNERTRRTSKVRMSGFVRALNGLNEDAEVVVNLVLETVGRELVLDRRVGLEARRNVWFRRRRF
jgi:hypothetical protein